MMPSDDGVLDMNEPWLVLKKELWLGNPARIPYSTCQGAKMCLAVVGRHWAPTGAGKRQKRHRDVVKLGVISAVSATFVFILSCPQANPSRGIDIW